MYKGCHDSLKHMLPLESHIEAYAQRFPADETLDSLDDFFEQLAGNAALITEACPQGNELSLLDAWGGETPGPHRSQAAQWHQRPQRRPCPAIRLRPPKLIRTS